MAELSAKRIAAQYAGNLSADFRRGENSTVESEFSSSRTAGASTRSVTVEDCFEASVWVARIIRP